VEDQFPLPVAVISAARIPSINKNIAAALAIATTWFVFIAW
jgi:hypothetical protein